MQTSGGGGMNSATFQTAADFLRAVAHPVRLGVIAATRDRSCSVGELAEVCGVSQALVSGHLRMLRQFGLVAGTRSGQRVYYRAVESRVSCILAWLANYQPRGASSSDCRSASMAWIL
jgi:DNA-binding transcriptional ArsR family regulator